VSDTRYKQEAVPSFGANRLLIFKTQYSKTADIPKTNNALWGDITDYLNVNHVKKLLSCWENTF
jgi:hypothetical protein